MATARVIIETTSGSRVSCVMDAPDLAGLCEGVQRPFLISTVLCEVQAMLTPGGTRWRTLAVALRAMQRCEATELRVRRVGALTGFSPVP